MTEIPRKLKVNEHKKLAFAMLQIWKRNPERDGWFLETGCGLAWPDLVSSKSVQAYVKSSESLPMTYLSDELNARPHHLNCPSTGFEG